MPGMKVKRSDVERYVRQIEPGKRASVQALRAFVRKQAPALTETIKWGNIVWTGKENVGWIIVYDNHVDFGFFKGAKLKDPEGLLEGTGKGLRHIKVYRPEDIRPGEYGALLKQALAMDGK